MSIWLMWAARQWSATDGRPAMWLHCHTTSRYVEAFNGVPVRVWVGEDPDRGDHWGFVRAGRDVPTLIQPTRGRFDMQFPYGPDAEAAHGRGRITRLTITEATDAQGRVVCPACGGVLIDAPDGGADCSDLGCGTNWPVPRVTGQPPATTRRESLMYERTIRAVDGTLTLSKPDGATSCMLTACDRDGKVEVWLDYSNLTYAIGYAGELRRGFETGDAVDQDSYTDDGVDRVGQPAGVLHWVKDQRATSGGVIVDDNEGNQVSLAVGPKALDEFLVAAGSALGLL